MRVRYERWLVYYVDGNTGRADRPCWGREVHTSKEACLRSVNTNHQTETVLDTDDVLVLRSVGLIPAIVCQRITLVSPELTFLPTPEDFRGQPHQRLSGAVS